MFKENLLITFLKVLWSSYFRDKKESIKSNTNKDVGDVMIITMVQNDSFFSYSEGYSVSCGA